ncbi:MAG: 2,4-dihydroxyhept-2-ene-1,7-dioic acid aldolase [Caldilineaceae bacterium]|nr:2,4-dihydroxyhept-2-ene-1,7-dioic acid aldolase [Caldilineaceae bacterium]
MKTNTAKQTMLAGNPAFGFSIALGSALSAEAISDTGVDFILLDRQHGSWGDDATIAALIAMRGGAATPMARVLHNDFGLIGRLLDEGMMGIVVPMVNTAEDAKAVADACRFPPTGQRSWGWGRARAYGSDYSDWIDDQIFVAVQIETAQAVENAEAILATPGVDGCWVGPSDLALTLGFHPSKMDEREEHANALQKVLKACENTGKIPGIAGRSVTDAVNRAELGFQFVTAGSDLGFVLSGADAALKTLRAANFKSAAKK